MRIFASSLIALLLMAPLGAADKKQVEVLHIASPLTIDARLDEEVYTQVQPARDFLQIQPYNGRPSFQPSEVYFFYDQTAIYVGAMLYDSSPDSIFNYLTERDNIGFSDYFGLYIDPYNQGQLAYGFFITPSGVQTDIKAIKNSNGDQEDGSWNAVWESETRITDKGWVVEMRIPYSSLRFSENTGAVWGMNMFRNIRRYNSNSSWSLISRQISGFIHQQGEMIGIKDVDPPLRLSLSPYLATYYETNKAGGKSGFLYKGGLDLKYGINESFTLDMMLIPDFGQIQSDDHKLNLSPFELYYDEKRQFFNEGTELFRRGDIFYSRRIGASPKFSANSNDNEVVDFSPSETQLLNATKISGRTNSGWGLGVLNAMSLRSFAVVRDTVSGVERDELVQPFSNYNVSVVDKSLRNNSYISLINTNVTMVGSAFRANVTATEFQFRNKSMDYALKGMAALSHRGLSNYETGYSAQLGFQKNKGDFQFGASQFVVSDKYNPNDLGYLERNNKVSTESYVYYQIVEPFWIFREVSGDIWGNYERMYSPNAFSSAEVGYEANLQFSNNYRLYLNGGVGSESFDYFETRVPGRYFRSPGHYWYELNLDTDSRKDLYLGFSWGAAQQFGTDQYWNEGEFEMNLRLGQHFQLEYEFDFDNKFNEVGFAGKKSDNSQIYFAKRNVNALENVLGSSYVINNKMGVSLRMRHYWSGANMKEYYLLRPDGGLTDYPEYANNHNQNFNAFTLDVMYRWNFAPGSELVLAWKGTAYAQSEQVLYNYWQNIRDTWMNQSNSLSLKVLYYIDYNNLKR